MSWVRVAVASTDGYAIDQSLQDASQFSIYDVAAEGPLFVEKRSAPQSSLSTNSDQDSSELTFEDFLDLISDCSILLVRSFGFQAGGKLRIGWITVYEAEMQVEKALRKFSNSPLIRTALGVKRTQAAEAGNLLKTNYKRGSE